MISTIVNECIGFDLGTVIMVRQGIHGLLVIVSVKVLRDPSDFNISKMQGGA